MNATTKSNLSLVVIIIGLVCIGVIFGLAINNKIQREITLNEEVPKTAYVAIENLCKDNPRIVPIVNRYFDNDGKITTREYKIILQSEAELHKADVREAFIKRINSKGTN